MVLCGTALAQQTIEFNSLEKTQGFPALFNGRAQYTDKINGTFTRPTGTAGQRVPVMVIMHSSAGMSPISTGEWSDFFLRMGVATFVVDSFGPRGITSTANDQSLLSYGASTVDALTALKAVAALPNVDATRIGVIGFSRGGIAAVNASFNTVIKGVTGNGSGGDLKFALHIAFYSGCAQIATPSKQPILFFIGDDDDYYPIAKCNAFIDQLKAKGANLTYVVYPGAKHGFDIDRPQLYAARAQHAAKCGLTIQDLDDSSYSIDGVKATSQEFGAYYGKCLSTGLTVGPDPKAKKDSREKVTAFVRKNFAM